MSDAKVTYPGAGCVVEFMQGNSPTLAIVLEEQGGKLRLYTQNRRESSLAASRLLPWSGPMLGPNLSRQAMDAALEERCALRAALAADISLAELWELVEGELEKTSAAWLAGLIWEKPDVNHEAAMGRALLEGKTHFRFSSPDFAIFPREAVEKRLQEAETARLRETVILAGANFFRALWDRHCRRRGPLTPQEIPPCEAADRLRALIMQHLQDPESQDEGGLWKQLAKGLPGEVQNSPHLALYLAGAWGLVPEHHNYLLDRIGFERGEDWAAPFAEECARLREAVVGFADISPDADSAAILAPEQYTFVSVDPVTTLDRDDAFFVEKTPTGYHALVALACPALFWPFGGSLDRQVLRRSSSLYLPEGDEHMLPASVGRALFSLDQGCARPALLLDVELDETGAVLSFTPRVKSVCLAANLSLEECEVLLQTGAPPQTPPEGLCPSHGAAPPPDRPGRDLRPCTLQSPETLRSNVSGKWGSRGLSPLAGESEGAAPHQEAIADIAVRQAMLRDALALSRLLQATRIQAGAVITERPDPELRVTGEGEDAVVHIDDTPPAPLSHLVVGELMVLCNGLVGAWARDKGIPMLFRTQDVAIPREFSGVWTEPADISRVVRVLPPAILEMQPRKHAGLGLPAYATLSSPIRRYVDLLNQGQVVSFLQSGAPRLSAEALAALFPLISARQDAVGQVQRFRPRYWKLLFFRQQGDKRWWDAVVVDENETWITVSLPWAQLVTRGRRRLFDEKTQLGQGVQIRLGKIDPLMNEIQIIEARDVE